MSERCWYSFSDGQTATPPRCGYCDALMTDDHSFKTCVGNLQNQASILLRQRDAARAECEDLRDMLRDAQNALKENASA